MPLFTKMLKLRSFSEMRVGKYLLYALGEIVLVVVGILLALNINNKNEENNQKKLLNGILDNVSYDLAQDTLVLGYAIKYYEERRDVAIDVINEKYTIEDFKKCGACINILVHYFPVEFNDKGYTQLRNFYDKTEQRDTLASEIVQFYKAMNSLSNDIKEQVKYNSLKTIETWRDSQPWFSEALLGQPSEEYYRYMTTQDFKNRVAHYYVIAGQNYLRILQGYKLNATEILKLIKAREEAD